MSSQAATAAAPRPNSRRTVLLLTLCQAVGMTGNSILATTSAIVGNILATDKALSTLPVAVQMTGTMAATVPAALLMARLGRRCGFWGGTAVGFTGAVIAFFAIWHGSFAIYCCGTFLLGSYNGVIQQYRFAASEVAEEGFRSKAISLVLAGGVVSAILGPESAKWSSELFAPVTYAGCFAVIALLCMVAAALLCVVRLPPAPPPQLRGGGRPLREIAAQPLFIGAVVAAMVGYGVMSLVMTATPIAMLGCGFGFADAAFVIQWHALGMYAPSFATGHLINRFGVTRILLVGAACLLACCGINLAGTGEVNFWAALVLLGLGWNFLFVGATTLLTRTYTAAERGKVQALNDFLVFGTVAVSSFSSGVLLTGAGWRTVQLAMLPLVAIALAVIFAIRLRAGRTAAGAARYS